MIHVKVWKDLDPAEKRRLLARCEADIEGVFDDVRPVIEAVRERGDAALREFTLKFDKADISGLQLAASEEEFTEAERALAPAVKEALVYSIENARAFHESQKPPPLNLKEIRPGLFAGERASPVSSVGLYVPRGRGSFPSMLYMLAVPALTAGVKDIRVVTPPGPGGKIDGACLFAAKVLGLREVFRVGGVQAVAALAYGTQSLSPVVKLTGPGSRYVTAAKRLLSAVVDTGLPAGPSESIVLSDGTTDVELVVMDLLIEAEHGSDSSALLVCACEKTAREAAALLSRRIEELPQPRRGFARDVFANYGGVILAGDIAEAADIVNAFAPEHLMLHSLDPLDLLPLIENAGEILLGPATPFSLANYACGANAVLPTGGRARTFSAVSVRDFIKYSSVVYSSPSGFAEVRDRALVLAEYEGFPAHAAALRGRDKTGGPSA